MNISNYIIDEGTGSIECLRILEKNVPKILFVTSKGKLFASITDGDIRRWLIKGGKINVPISDIAKRNPIYTLSENLEVARDIMLQKAISAIPIIDNEGRIIDIVFNSSRNPQRNKNKINLPVVIMAGGLGTRLYPYTKILPKPLIPVGDIPISERIINLFQSAGCNKFFMIVNYKKNMIKAYYNEADISYDVSFIEENKPLGTGGGLFLLKDVINEPFILTNCDTLIYEDYYEIVSNHIKDNNLITMICSLKNHTIPYGVIELDDDGSISKMREKPLETFMINTGSYIVNPDVFNYIEPNENIGFPDVISRIMNLGGRVGVYPVSDQSWLDMGQFDSMEIMSKKLEEIEKA